MKVLIKLKTIVWNEVRRFWRIWPQSLLASALMAMLYFIIFGQIAASNVIDTLHASYLQFIAPGLILMAVITNSYGNVAYSVTSHRLQKSMEELIIAPIPNVIILIGFMIGGVLRGLFVGLIVTGIALGFTDLTFYDPLVAGFVLILASMLFSLCGFTNAIFADRYEDVVWVPTFILNPLIYLGGVFFSIAQLPEGWQTIAKVNPVLYLIDAFRYGMIGVADVEVAGGLIFLTVLVIVVFSLNLILINNGVGFSK